jgi:mannose-6-phosphate isomerase-like protein (cupin superfamily)
MDIKSVIESGMLEAYVIGALSTNEKRRVEGLLEVYPVLREEIQSIERALASYADNHSVEVDPTIKPMMMAMADYENRILNGEKIIMPPSLDVDSGIQDYSYWLNNDQMAEPDSYDGMYGKILGKNDERLMMIVWLTDGAPDETHTDELEKFLIVEGRCNIIIGDKVHALEAGDYLSIPLWVNHRVEVTSPYRCKIILERSVA